MITYGYWFAVLLLAAAAIAGLGWKGGYWKTATGTAAAVVLVGWSLNYFYLEQLFVKRWGGVMTIHVPEGRRHMGATWKEDNLWIENYDPATNTCHFTEYSRGHMLEGRVTVKNCSPLMPE